MRQESNKVKKVDINQFKQGYELIERLKGMIQRGEKREITGYAIVIVERDGSIGTEFSKGYNCNSKMIGALEQLKYRLLTE
jgi:hypothetical protein